MKRSGVPGWALLALLVLICQPLSARQVLSTDDYSALHPGVQIDGLPFYQPTSSGDEVRTYGTVFGTTLATGATPEESAWNHVAEISPLLGEGWGELVPEVKPNGQVLMSVARPDGSMQTGFYTFRYNQQYQGLPVFRSGIGFLVRNNGNYPLVMSGIDIKQMNGLTVPALSIDKPQVTTAMRDNVHKLMDIGTRRNEKSVLEGTKKLALKITERQYVIYAGTQGRYEEPKVAIQFIAERGSIGTLPDYNKYRIVADVATSEILLAENEIHEFTDITGTASGRATNGLGALECHGQLAVGLPYAEVAVTGGNTAFANASGNFVIPHPGTTSVTVTSYLRGRWFDLRDESAGSVTPSIAISVTPPGPANFLHNPAPNSQFPNANVNAYLESNVVRDYVLAAQPTYPTIGTQTSFRINNNINSTCNAFYNGTSINFYRNGGGCNNTAFSDVVYHEYGHHLINVTGNGQGMMGEGSGDVCGVLIQDEPILGAGFQQNCAAGIRSASNTLQYPCSGGIHFCGQLLSGAVWDTRNQLAVTSPSTYRTIGAQLFFGMLMVRGQLYPGDQTIDNRITAIYVELDDDDNDIGNGTPHYNEIAAGFGAHNMPAPPLVLIDFIYPNGRPAIIGLSGGVQFNVQVIPMAGTPQPNTGTLHVDMGSGFQAIPMNQISPNLYQANFPAGTCGQSVKYYFSALTTTNVTQYDPVTAPTSFFTGVVASAVSNTFDDNGETNPGWTVTGSATDGQWNRGIPANGNRGDPPSDGDGSGQCWLTDNVAGNSDVDGGDTILTSPLLDASVSGNQIAVLSYMRWYSNNTGGEPETDVFVVQISNNNGATWTNVETVGPSGTEVRGGWFSKTFRIADFVTPTNQMRVRFNASDAAGGSVVEAAIDAVKISRLSCDLAPPLAGQSFKFLDGSRTSGVFGNLTLTDDIRTGFSPAVNPNLRKQRVEMGIDSVSPVFNPAIFRFRVESRFAGGPQGDVKQTIFLINQLTGGYEQVDTRAVTLNDSVTEVAATGSLSRFVNQTTGEIRAVVRWESPTFAGTPFTWTTESDQIVWLIQ
jgi:hypothetical protein